MYYLLRFKNNDGNYAYSSYITVQVRWFSGVFQTCPA
jgi:hypothetical protein